MNLMKLFNFSYFKENLKKSKGILAFFFGVIPLINIIMLIVLVNEAGNSSGFVVANLSDVGVITLLGLYVIPIIFAVSLFGFVFKKKNVDFIMSKPISRKSLYFTNVIGGIAILTLFMLLNTLIFGLFSLLFDSLIFPLGLLIDYFIILLVAYIFMFSISVLAITLAGNFMSSFVILLIILFIYPFFLGVNLYYQDDNSYYIKCDESTCAPTYYNCDSYKKCEEKLVDNYYEINNLNKDVTYKLTTPVAIFTGEETVFNFNLFSLFKMIVLSIVYFILGLVSFEKRKMENNEMSFKSEFIHYLVKTITMIPVSFVAYLLIMSGDGILLLVAVVASLIYYVIYDILTRKEIYRFMKSVLVCLITVGCFSGVYYFYGQFTRNRSTLLNNVNQMSIEYNDELVVVKDKKVVNDILKDNLNTKFKNVNNYRNYYSNLVIDREKYSTFLTLSESAIKKLYNDAQEEKIKKFNFNNFDYVKYENTYIPITKELKNLIKNSNKTQSNNDDYLYVYKYQNHHYERVTIHLDNNKELEKYIVNLLNEKAIKLIENNKVNYVDFYLSDMGAFVSSDNDYNFLDREYAVFNYVLNENIDSFIEYLRNNNSEVKTKLKIDVYTYSQYGSIIINDTKSFVKEYEKYKEKVQNNEEYLDIINSMMEEDYEY